MTDSRNPHDDTQNNNQHASQKDKTSSDTTVQQQADTGGVGSDSSLDGGSPFLQGVPDDVLHPGGSQDKAAQSTYGEQDSSPFMYDDVSLSDSSLPSLDDLDDFSSEDISAPSKSKDVENNESVSDTSEVVGNLIPQEASSGSSISDGSDDMTTLDDLPSLDSLDASFVSKEIGEVPAQTSVTIQDQQYDVGSDSHQSQTIEDSLNANSHKDPSDVVSRDMQVESSSQNQTTKSVTEFENTQKSDEQLSVLSKTPVNTSNTTQDTNTTQGATDTKETSYIHEIGQSENGVSVGKQSDAESLDVVDSSDNQKNSNEKSSPDTGKKQSETINSQQSKQSPTKDDNNTKNRQSEESGSHQTSTASSQEVQKVSDQDTKDIKDIQNNADKTGKGGKTLSSLSIDTKNTTASDSSQSSLQSNPKSHSQSNPMPDTKPTSDDIQENASKTSRVSHTHDSRNNTNAKTDTKKPSVHEYPTNDTQENTVSEAAMLPAGADVTDEFQQLFSHVKDIRGLRPTLNPSVLSSLKHRLLVDDHSVALIGGHNPQADLQHVYAFSSRLPSSIASIASSMSSDASYLVIEKYEIESLEAYSSASYDSILVLAKDTDQSYLFMLSASIDAPMSLDLNDSKISRVVYERLSKLDIVVSSLVRKVKREVNEQAAKTKTILKSLRNF